MPGSGSPGVFARVILLLTAVAVIAGLASLPRLAGGDRTGLVGDSYDGYDTSAAERLRQDQCVAADALRQGGPNLSALAQGAIGLTPDQLHQKVDRNLSDNNTPLHQAFYADSDNTDQWTQKLQDQGQSWSGAVSGLDSYPGAPRGAGDIFDQVGLRPWLWQSYFKAVDLFSPFYDPSPTADDATKAAALTIGNERYTSGGTPQERQAWELWKKNSGKIEPNVMFVPRVFADDARVFLSSGGFPTTAPAPDSAEFRIAVEDLKSRFAACAWHDPIDPGRVLGKEVAQASAEWQQEIASQATQRQQILGAGATATKALQDGAFALGRELGQSWIADYSTRWLDYSTEGGIGWIGDAPLEIQVPGATGKCLDVQGGAKTNGTPVQIYTCNGGAAQKWQLWGSYEGGYQLLNPNSSKCLEVAGGATADGTKIQIRDCAGTKAQQWTFDVRNVGALRNAASGKCLHLPTFDNSKDAVSSTCNGSSAQKLRVVPKGHTGTVAAKADVDQAKANVTAAQAEAKKQLGVVQAQLATAQKAATTSDTALQSAYGVADASGAPRGRGLLVGQQKDQVTRGAVAALQALAKAGETAEAATRASAGDSAAITQRALAQAAQSKAEFRKEAAARAEWQAKAAADAARLHRDNARTDKETAEAKLTVALKAEGDAKAAAADAHAKRLTAEAEERTAKAEKETATARRAEAAGHRQNAEAEAVRAKDARDSAEAFEKTAGDRRDEAVAARDRAKDKRDDAWDAEQKADAARAKADAKDAYAESLTAGDAADAARAAADGADAAATDAEAAATRARSEADAATRAAAEADAAATRAEAAAKRSRAAADAAQADKLKADAAVRTSTSAVADAIKASQDASSEAKTAVALADEAEQHAKDARNQADEAKKQAAIALAAAVKAAGYAHVTAQAAADAHQAAAKVAAPANDAVQLGAPYVDTDAAAGLVVLTGQGAKSVAEQQAAVADAHAANAAGEAQAARNIADQASSDTKEAYQHAATAAQYAADARTYSKQALGYASEAAKAAAAAASSLARTIEYDQQATSDAAAADDAADHAEGWASDARDAADAAELDAAAARSAASAAEQDARDARSAADRADTAATEAETAAKDADRYADEAQEAAERAERAEAGKQVQTGAATGVGGVFSVIDEIRQRGEPERLPNECHGIDCNTMVFVAHFDAVVSYYLCLDPDEPATESGCPAEDTVFLKTQTFTGLSKTVKVSAWDVTKDVWKGIYDSIIGDFTGCYHKLNGDGSGSYGDCAWAATWLPIGGPMARITEAIRAVDASLRTGVGVSDALKALKALDVDAQTVAAVERSVNAFDELRTACRTNSFPGSTQVVLADGRRKALRDVRPGDLLLATDPATLRTRGEPVTRTFHHTATDLLDVVLADGGSLTTTPGHRFFVTGRGWTLASDLRAGDALRGPDGTPRRVTEVSGRHESRPRTVYDLTVSGLHTFYAVAENSPVLVHNCNDLVADDQAFPRLAHALDEHTAGYVTRDEAKALAEEKGGPNGVFLDVQTAQQVVDYALADKAGEITRWLRGSAREKALTGYFGAKNSLGYVAQADGSFTAAGNGYKIVLKRAKGHKFGYYVYTAYPV
ncbi:ricin-type beta-trefoil lectin domain protein [Streptomyces sp. NPDC046860]|uniref:ricin-type beta-trefoil lectin domain protein n=1 Tax=Streptomyces sp. NPDC046860 TaxID=3154495 RepID=UPI0033EA009A